MDGLNMTNDAHEDSAFEAMCREHQIEGTAMVALCGAFWNRAIAGKEGAAEPVAWHIDTHGVASVAIKKSDLGLLAERYARPLGFIDTATPPAVLPAAPSDAEIDALDKTFALHVMAPRGKASVREFARAVLALSQAMQPQAEPDGWREALQFYAGRSHFNVADDDAWDTVSGEPQNFWCDEAGTATIEDGTVAAMALAGTPLRDEDEEAPQGMQSGERKEGPWCCEKGEAAGKQVCDECAAESAGYSAAMAPCKAGRTDRGALVCDGTDCYSCDKNFPAEPNDTPLETGEGDAR